jgi:hypothetical protein
VGAEPAEAQTGITQHLGITEEHYWPHVTLGLAPEDFPTTTAKAMNLPSVKAAAPSLDLGDVRHRIQAPSPDALLPSTTRLEA